MKEFTTIERVVKVTAFTREGHMLQENFYTQHWTTDKAIEHLLLGYWADKNIHTIEATETLIKSTKI